MKKNRPRNNNTLGQSSGMEIGKDGHHYVCYICRDGGKLLCCDYCPKTYHMQSCLDPPLQCVPKKKWGCPNCLQERRNRHPLLSARSRDPLLLSNNLFATNKKRPRDNYRLGQSSGLKIGEDGHYYVCLNCRDGGQLLCCDSCPNTYHIQCLDRPLLSIPEGEWECTSCRRERCEICNLGGTLQSCDNCHETYHLDCLDPAWLKRISEEGLKGSICSPKCAAVKRANHLYQMVTTAKGIPSLSREENRPEKYSLGQSSGMEIGEDARYCEICKHGGKLQSCDNCGETYHFECLDAAWLNRISEERLKGSFCSPKCAAVKRVNHIYKMAVAAKVIPSLRSKGVHQ